MSNEKTTPVKRRVGRPYVLGTGYTHFCLSKKTGLIINGWDYRKYDQEELMSEKDHYFFGDCEDFYENGVEMKPKDMQIITREKLIKKGVVISDTNSWHKNN